MDSYVWGMVPYSDDSDPALLTSHQLTASNGFVISKEYVITSTHSQADGWLGGHFYPLGCPQLGFGIQRGLHLCPGSATGSWYKVGQEIKVSELRISSSVQWDK